VRGGVTGLSEEEGKEPKNLPGGDAWGKQDRSKKKSGKQSVDAGENCGR